jgi:hypothetical protein
MLLRDHPLMCYKGVPNWASRLDVDRRTRKQTPTRFRRIASLYIANLKNGISTVLAADPVDLTAESRTSK